MDSWITLRHLVEAVVLLVLVRHAQGAAQVFSPVKGQRLSPILYSFVFANAFTFYKVFNAALEPRLVAPGIAAFVGSFVLFEWSLRTIRGKFFSYAGTDDVPQFLLTSGPYAYVRNPFYASYLLAYVGAAILFPGIATFLVFVLMALFLTKVAQFEERKFERSPQAAEYAAYRRRTGMFIPRLSSIKKP
jgi:protein-S-isoprenylcysteine O-methyltransferase Ste14